MRFFSFWIWIFRDAEMVRPFDHSLRRVISSFMVTLIGTTVLDTLLTWNAGLLALAAFAASGFWMVVGSWWRHVHARRAGQDAQREEVR